MLREALGIDSRCQNIRPEQRLVKPTPSLIERIQLAVHERAKKRHEARKLRLAFAIDDISRNMDSEFAYTEVDSSFLTLYKHPVRMLQFEKENYGDGPNKEVWVFSVVGSGGLEIERRVPIENGQYATVEFDRTQEIPVVRDALVAMRNNDVLERLLHRN